MKGLLGRRKKEEIVKEEINPNSKLGKIALARANIKKKYKNVTSFKLGEDVVNTNVVKTGIESFDNSLNGGLPIGGIIQVAGPESTGKTSLAHHIISLFDSSVLLDFEQVFDPDRMKFFGCKEDNVYIEQPEHAEQGFEIIYEYIDAGIDLVVIDSVAEMQPKKIAESGDVGYNTVGALAGLLNTEIPKLRRKAQASGTTILLLNQVRDNMDSGGAFKNPYDYNIPGGRRLKHNCTFTVMMVKGVQHKMTVDGVEYVIGQTVKTKTIKSRMGPPSKRSEFLLYYNYGFCNLSEKDAVREIVKERIKKDGFGTLEKLEEESGIQAEEE